VSHETPVVVVTGPPASGKSTVAALLAQELRLPLVAKDVVKELLFDALGTGDIAWSQRLGRAVYPLLLHVVELELRANRSCIVEANFDHDAAGQALRALQRRQPFRAVQIVCAGDPEVLVRRYAARAGTRHPGHVDIDRVEEIRAAIAAGRWRLLDLEGESVEIDTTDWALVDTDRLVEWARRRLAT
jgi:predicted kinase